MKKLYTLHTLFTLLSLFTLISLFSCEKAINFNLENSKPLLVVDAEIENNKAPRVVLSNSISYYSQVSADVFAKSFVHDADVSISNGTVTQKLIEYSYPITPEYNAYYYGIDSSSLNNAFIGELNTTYDLKIIVEARNLDEIKEILAHEGVYRILIDNFNFDDTRKAVALIGNTCQTESSGNINEETIRSYAECGVNYISSGALTHSIYNMDLSLKAF